MSMRTRRAGRGGPSSRGSRPVGRLASVLAGSKVGALRGASALLFPLLVFLAAAPFTGWPLAVAWFFVMTILTAADRRWLDALSVFAGRGARDAGAYSWLLGVGYSLAALYFVLVYTGAAQTFGVTLYGVIMFQILARDYTNPKRLLFNLVPPVLSIVLVQCAAAAALIVHGLPFQIVTLLASPCVVFLAFRTVQKDLTQSRRRLSEASVQAEASAREIEDAHRIALMAEDLAGVGHWRLDLRSGKFTCSDGFRRIYGLDPSGDLPGINALLEIHRPEDRALVGGRITEAMREGTPFSLEARITRADGEERRITANGAAERDGAGAVTTVFGATMDVTEARIREDALRQSESRFRLLADHSTDVVVWFSPDGTILYASPSARILGYAPEDVVGRRTFEFVHPDDRERAISVISGLFTGGTIDPSARGEYRFLTGDGRYIWLEGNPTIIRDDDGKPTSVVSSFRDVTPRRQLEDDLIEAKVRAEAAAEAKAQFLANMSHEIRTPLTGIIGFTGLLDAIPTLPDAAKAHIRRIVASGEALLAVVNDILDFSKLEAGQVELDVQPFDVRVFFEDALSMWATQAAAKKLDLRLRIDERTPAVLCADSARLGQIVGNLLSNAIKFTDQGEIGVGVSFNEPRGLRVAVTDTGSGIAADKLDRLFQRFSQIDGSVSRRHGGTGLGLSICKSLVELMGGEIRVDSTAGQGSTFEFRVEAVPGRLRGRNLSEAQAVAASDARPAHVLVVDDLAVNRVLVRAILEASGHRVEEAGGGAEAVAAAIGSKFDLILMDLQMPGMDGYAAATAIRALDSANRLTPIIALSANVLDEHVAASGLAGMNGHLAKPIVPAALLGAVAEWAGLRLAEKDDEVAGVSA